MSSNRLNVERLMEALSDILSEQHGAQITLRAEPKKEERKKGA